MEKAITELLLIVATYIAWVSLDDLVETLKNREDTDNEDEQVSSESDD